MHRNDITDSFEDFERILEDYFGIIPPDLDKFSLDKFVKWDFGDLDNSMILYFETEWKLDDFIEDLKESPTSNISFEFNEFSSVDREKLSITLIGFDGGLL